MVLTWSRKNTALFFREFFLKEQLQEWISDFTGYVKVLNVALNYILENTKFVPQIRNIYIIWGTSSMF